MHVSLLFIKRSFADVLGSWIMFGCGCNSRLSAALESCDVSDAVTCDLLFFDSGHERQFGLC